MNAYSAKPKRINYVGYRNLVSTTILKFLVTLSLWGHLSLATNPLQGGDNEALSSQIDSVAVAEPNLGALLGIANPLAAQLGSHAHRPSSGSSALDLKTLCSQSQGGNSDALTNLLVYQYLSGSLPSGATNAPNSASRSAAVPSSPQLQALLEGSLEAKTVTTVSTSLTVRTVNMKPSTKFSTSTTSYVTTVTSLASSVIPIIFRGSKITTTITDRLTDVLTATEFFTSSSVLTPSIVQTLPVEITLYQTSTRGLNGHYTLAQVTPGATKVIEKPISSATVDFDTKGLDLSSIDLSTLDLSSLTGGNGGGDSQMVNALTALLQQYSNGDDPREKDNRKDNRNEGRSLPQSRFHTNRNKDPRRREEDAPKFNVIRGFTLSDRAPSSSSSSNNGGGNSGTALENTRYSKFRKKNSVENNSLVGSAVDRESERFSASTDRRTVSRASQRRRDRQRSEQPSSLTGRSVSGGGSARTNRQTESHRRSSRNLRTQQDFSHVIRPSPNAIRSIPNRKFTFRTTVLTMHISGTRQGEIITTTRTVTLRGFQSTQRFKRQITPSTTKSYQKMTNTPLPRMDGDLVESDVIHLLQGLDRSKVKEMLHSLQDWVDFYVHQVLDEVVEPSFEYNTVQEDVRTNEIPELNLMSSITENDSSNQNPTHELNSLPGSITKWPNLDQPLDMRCASTVTETVYQTLYVPKS